MHLFTQLFLILFSTISQAAPSPHPKASPAAKAHPKPLANPKPKPLPKPNPKAKALPNPKPQTMYMNYDMYPIDNGDYGALISNSNTRQEIESEVGSKIEQKVRVSNNIAKGACRNKKFCSNLRHF